MANDQAFGSQPNRQIPALYTEWINIIGEAFERNDWYDFLESKSDILNQHSQQST
jgi:hypothetical protein